MLKCKNLAKFGFLHAKDFINLWQRFGKVFLNQDDLVGTFPIPAKF